jgi:hypothetical protein
VIAPRGPPRTGRKSRPGKSSCYHDSFSWRRVSPELASRSMAMLMMAAKPGANIRSMVNIRNSGCWRRAVHPPRVMKQAGPLVTKA